MTIRTFDDPILKAICEPVTAEDDAQQLHRQLQAACLEHNGAGLAAPQIGIAKRAIFIRYGKQHGITLINPLLSNLDEEMITMDEGCLSYPNVTAPIARHHSVCCTWTLPNGKHQSRKFVGWESRVLQHECDHLDGICKVGDVWRRGGNRKANQVVLAPLLALAAGGMR